MALLFVVGAVLAVLAVLFVAIPAIRTNNLKNKRSQLLKKVVEYQPPASPWRGQKWLVFYNPFSGYGEGEFVYDNILRPMFKVAGVEVRGIKTEYAGFAKSMLADKAFDLSPYCGIATISGDGSLHEIVNGLYARLGCPSDSDFSAFLREMPLALIPAGSSNGFATSLNLKDSFDGVKNIVEHAARPIDLLRINICDRKSSSSDVFWDFHTLSWAIGGEHDELQEIKLRWMPTELRNIIAPLIVIFQNKKHKGIMDFVPVKMTEKEKQTGHFSDESQLPVSPANPNARRIDDVFTMSAIYNSPAGAHDILMSTTLQPDDGAIELMLIRRASPIGLLKVFLAFEDASYLQNPLVEHYRVTELTIEPEAEEFKVFISGEKSKHGKVHIKNCHHLAMFIW